MTSGALIVELTARCNSSCEHCLREYRRSPRDVTWEDLVKVTEDMAQLDSGNRRVHLSGGEPTLWKDAQSGRDVFDAIHLFQSRGISTALVSNGLTWLSEKTCRSRIGRLMASPFPAPVELWFTVDRFHRNYDPDTCACPVFDQILKALAEWPRWNERIRLCVQGTLSKLHDDTGLLGVIMRYRPNLTRHNVNLLLPWGRAETMASLCPTLSPRGRNKASLEGAYRIVRGTLISRGLVADESAFAKLPNLDVFRLLTRGCRRAPLAYRSGNYYWCFSHMEDPHFRVARLGEDLREATTRFANENPLLARCRASDIVSTLEERAPRMSPAWNQLYDELLDAQVGVGFSGCDFCKQAHAKGLMRDPNAAFEPLETSPLSRTP